MGRLVFTSGEILTAANMNELSDQSVMVFADSSARSSAIPSPSEGMITYLEDTDAVEKYDGAAFVNVSSGGLVAVKSAINTGPEVFGSVAAGASVAVPDLSITHEVSDPANRLIISAFFGMAADSDTLARVGIAIHDGTGLINVGASPGGRTAVTAGGDATNKNGATMPSVTFVHTPGAGSKTYTVHAISVIGLTRNLFINRSVADTVDNRFPRAVSSLVIQEVAV